MGTVFMSFNSTMMALLVVVILLLSSCSFNIASSDLWEHLPPILSRRITPLNATSIASFAADLDVGSLIPAHINIFCEQAGLLCNQSITVFPVLLHALADYRLTVQPAKKEEAVDPTIFFGESKLSVGNSLKLPSIPKRFVVPQRAFLPRALAERLPFSSQDLPELLRLFGFSNDSNMALSMAKTLEVCEQNPREGELKRCVTSIEAMMEFVTWVLGTRDVEMLGSSKISWGGEVKVMSVVEMESGRKASVGCHNAMFPYEVFYCHSLQGSKVYKVVVLEEFYQGRNILSTNVVTCHSFLRRDWRHESGEWMPMLYEKRGELLCHWNYGSNLVWIPTT